MAREEVRDDAVVVPFTFVTLLKAARFRFELATPAANGAPLACCSSGPRFVLLQLCFVQVKNERSPTFIVNQHGPHTSVSSAAPKSW